MIFKKGLYELNSNPNYNFQLNRLIHWSRGDLDEVKSISGKIKNHSDWKNELIRLGDCAFSEDRIEQAIGYYRMSEFFMTHTDPDKTKYYQKAVDMFRRYYKKYFEEGIIKYDEVPFDDIVLPVMYAESQNEKKGVILLHGGNDSYYEELFFPMLYLSEQGYDVYLFEGPGQGGVLRTQHKIFTYQWEKPVSAILNYFSLNDVILIGISLGGMLAPRAAAFEKRVRAVVVWGAFPSFWDIIFYDMPRSVGLLFKGLIVLKMKPCINMILNFQARKDLMMQWALSHGRYAYGAETPYDYLIILKKFQMLNIASQIEQDILILHGMEDHFINWHLSATVLNALTHAKSITLRIFSKKENASNHCQCGNSQMALDTILCWLDSITER